MQAELFHLIMKKIKWTTWFFLFEFSKKKILKKHVNEANKLSFYGM